MKTLVYLNPQSGQGRAEKIYLECRDAIAAACGETTIVMRPEQISHEFQKNLFQRVIIIGGDGTVHVVVNEMMKVRELFVANPPEIAVLSSGTGCDLSRSLKRASPISNSGLLHKPGLGPSLLEELERLTANLAVPFDIGLARMDNGKKVFYCNSASIGLGGYACGKQKNWNKKLPTSLSYLLPGFQAVFSYKGADMQIFIQNEEAFKGHCLGTMIYNGAFSGGGMLWAPQSSVSDGQFDLIVINPLNPLKIPEAVKRLFTGTIDLFPGLIVNKGKSFTIQSLKAEALPAEFDGEYFESKKFEISVEVAALKILVSP